MFSALFVGFNAKLAVDEIAAKADKLGLTRRDEAVQLIRQDRDR